MSRLRSALAPLLLLTALLLIWETLVIQLEVPSYILPQPPHLLATFFSQFGFLWPHILTTLGEILLGLALGAAGGFALGTAMFYSKWVERALRPLIIASQMVPVFAKTRPSRLGSRRARVEPSSPGSAMAAR